MDLLTTPEIAKRLGVTVKHVQNLISAGELKAERFGRDYMVPYESLLEYLRAGKEVKMVGRGAPRLKLDYWTMFGELLSSRSNLGRRLPKPQPESWMALSVGKNCRVAAHFRLREKLIGVDLTLGKGGKDLFHALRAGESEIAKEMRAKGVVERMDWQGRLNAVESWVLTRRPADPADREDWPKQHEWLAVRFEAFYEVFKSHIAQLKAWSMNNESFEEYTK